MTGRPDLVAVPERYVDAGELAALMGVSVRTIARMVTAGMPSETWGMRRTRRFLPSQAMAWAHQRATMSPTRNGDRYAAGEHNRRDCFDA